MEINSAAADRGSRPRCPSYLLGDGDLRLDRIGDEADLMRFMMHLVQLCLVRRLAAPLNSRMQHDLCHGLLARRDRFHDALRVIAIGRDGEARQRGDAGPAVKADRMAAAVAAVPKILTVLEFPTDISGIGRHCFLTLCPELA